MKTRMTSPIKLHNKGQTEFPAGIRLSGYSTCFSGIRLFDRIVDDIRPDNRIITKFEVILRVVKHILENKNILDKFHIFITSPFINKSALAHMKSNNL